MIRILIYFPLFIGLIVSILKLIATADRLPMHIDEQIFAYAAYTFLTNLDYIYLGAGIHPQNFNHLVSNGIVGSWPAGLVFLFDGNLLGARIIQSLYSMTGFLVVGYFGISAIGIKRTTSLLITFLLWTIYLHTPYWHGFILSLGELNTALLIIAGLIAMEKNPTIGFFLWGLAIWHIKVVFIPIVGLFSISYLLTENFSLTEFFKNGLKLFIVFIAPLAVWAILVFTKNGFTDMLEYIDIRYIFTSEQATIVGSDKFTKFGISNFMIRMQTLEWATYPVITKIKILFLLFGSQLLFLTTAVYNFQRISRRELLYGVSLVLFINLISFHYFLLHPFMWIRHLQPALITCFFLICYLSVKYSKDFFSKKNGLFNRIFSIAILIIIGLEAAPLIRSESFFKNPESEARKCIGSKGLSGFCK